MKKIAWIILMGIGGANWVFGSGVQYTRQRLIRMWAQGMPGAENVITSMDAGVRGWYAEDGNLHCEFLSPQPGSRAAQPKRFWKPLDVYTNTGYEKMLPNSVKKRVQKGEPDIFFEGDDNNRNGRDDSFEKTFYVEPTTTDSLIFSDWTSVPDGHQVFLKVIRGPKSKRLHLEALLRMAVRPSANGECVSKMFYCPGAKQSKEGTRYCPTGGWTYQVDEILGTADRWGLLNDVWNEPVTDQDRNDLQSLDASLTPVDAKGEPTGERKRFRLATKGPK